MGLMLFGIEIPYFFKLTFLLVQKSNKKRPRQTITARLSVTAICIGCTTVTSTSVTLLLNSIFTINQELNNIVNNRFELILANPITVSSLTSLNEN